MDFNTYAHNVIVLLPSNVGNGASEIQEEKVFIKAKRDILTPEGLIKKGAKGWVSKTWAIRAATNNGCACGGSANWFSYARE